MSETVSTDKGLEVVATSWKYQDRPCVDFKFAPDPYAKERGFLTEIEPLVRLSDAADLLQQQKEEIERLTAERDAMAKVIDPEDNRPALMARIIMASIERLCRAEAAERENKALREALEPFAK